MGNNIVFRCDKDSFNVPKSFSYKDSWVDFSCCTILYQQVYCFFFQPLDSIEVLPNVSRCSIYIGLKSQINPTLERSCNKIQKLSCKIYINFLIDLGFLLYFI